MSSSPSSTPWSCRLFALDPDQLSPWETLLLQFGAAVTLAVLALTFLDVFHYAGVDLRNRVVGARVLLAGEDPYAFRWQPGLPLELLDPVYDPKAHRLTVPP